MIPFIIRFHPQNGVRRAVLHAQDQVVCRALVQFVLSPGYVIVLRSLAVAPGHHRGLKTGIRDKTQGGAGHQQPFPVVAQVFATGGKVEEEAGHKSYLCVHMGGQQVVIQGIPGLFVLLATGPEVVFHPCRHLEQRRKALLNFGLQMDFVPPVVVVVSGGESIVNVA